MLPISYGKISKGEKLMLKSIRLLFLVLLLSLTGFISHRKTPFFFQRFEAKTVSWQTPIQKEGVLVIPGSIQADFGSFDLQWHISNHHYPKLITFTPSGSSALPSWEKPILIWPRQNGTTHLFMQRIPLLNEEKPYTLQRITTVPTEELFSVIPERQLPPFSLKNLKTTPLHWGKMYMKNNAQYLPGTLAIPSSPFSIAWRKKPRHTAELVALQTPEAGETDGVDVHLYLWMDPKKDLTLIFQERYPLLHPNSTTYLWPIAVVSQSKLMNGFKQVNR